MLEVILDGQVVCDPWMRWHGEAHHHPEGPTLLTWGEWTLLNGAQKDWGVPLGLWLETSQEPDALAPVLKELALIVVHYAVFTDGRGHSLARLLRERFGFEGELRAVGDVFRDTVHELARCGFNGFAVREGETVHNALLGLTAAREAYQTSWDRPEPLFRRRIEGGRPPDAPLVTKGDRP